MMWLAWRQFRAPAAAGLAAVAVLAAVLALTGPGLAADYAAGIAGCTPGGGCEQFTGQFFQSHQNAFLAVMAVMLVMPVLVGLFWGAPLIARELEAGTHRLVWNQSITRARWLAVKLALCGLGAITVGGLASLAVSWWSRTLDQAAFEALAPLAPPVFGARGVAPIGYAVFAFALGVVVGMLVRRTLAAMAVTVAVLVAVQVAVPILVRPYLLPSTRLTTEASPAVVSGIGMEPDGSLRLGITAPEQGAWLLSGETIDSSGNAVERVVVSTTSGPCAPTGTPERFFTTCLPEINRLGYRIQLSYHAPGRFWPLQWMETALYLAMALGLAGFSFWHLRRRHC